MLLVFVAFVVDTLLSIGLPLVFTQFIEGRPSYQLWRAVYTSTSFNFYITKEAVKLHTGGYRRRIN